MLKDDIESAYDVVYELLFNSDFSDTENLKALVQRLETYYESDVTSSPTTYLAKRVRAKKLAEYSAQEYQAGLTFIDFLKNVETELEENPEHVISKLNEVVTILKNKQNASSIFVGDN
jgi:Zn-dependent M16 (insulinase) family peptidase